MILCIQILWIESFPPCADAVRLCCFAIVRNAGKRAFFVRSLSSFVPEPSMRSMDAHAKAQAVFTGRTRPAADDILLRSDRNRIPGLVLPLSHKSKLSWWLAMAKK